MIQDLTITSQHLESQLLKHEHDCTKGFKSFQLWMEEFGLMHSPCRLCEGGQTDSECTEVWAVKPGSCKGNPVKQKDDVFSCKMAPCLGQDSRISPLKRTQTSTGIQNGDSSGFWSCSSPTECQHTVLWPNVILHTNCAQYEYSGCYTVLAVSIQLTSDFFIGFCLWFKLHCGFFLFDLT